MAARALANAEVPLEIDERGAWQVALVEQALSFVGGAEDPPDIGEPKIRVVDRGKEFESVDEWARAIDHAADASLGRLTEPTERVPVVDQVVEPGATPSQPTLGGRMTAAVGTAMLGLEHAMRREPPAEVVVSEHQPERGLSGADPDLLIEFPDDH
jgi:hypothetical protein